MRKLSVRLPESTELRLRRAAKRLGRPHTDIIGEAIEQYLNRSEREHALPPSVGMGSNAAVTAVDYEMRFRRDLL